MAELATKGFQETFVASGNLDTSQFRFVRLVGLDVYMADSGFADGVLQNKPLDNEHADVVMLGGTKISLSASLGSAVYIGCGSGGWAVQATGEGRRYGRLIVGATSGAYGVMYFSDIGSL